MRSGKRRRALSFTRDGQGAWAAAMGWGTKLQHLAANHRKQHATPVTGLTIHDIVILP
jgi:hypothetical protein